MAEPNAEKNEHKDRDELFWLFPVLLVVAIIAITIFVQSGNFSSRLSGGMGLNGTSAEPTGLLQAGREVIVPETEGDGVRTLDELSELLLNDLYQSEEDPVGEGTYEESVLPGPGLRIIMHSDMEDEGNRDIYLIDETGYNPVRLSDWDSSESFPAITSDGSRVYFVSDKDDDPNNPNPFAKNSEIYMIDLELFGTDAYAGPVRLTYNDEMDYGVSVSADGSRMVYMSATKDNPDNPVMILADGDANNGVVIADTYLKNAVPKLSGDGNYIAYNSFLDGEMDIYLYDINNESTINLTHSDIPEYFPAINYDGSIIIYEKLLGGTPQAESFVELFVCDRDGGNERQITMNRFADSFPTISDDGQWIVFISKRWDFTGDGHYDEALFYMDINGENVMKITKDPYFQWQPDI